MKKKAFVHMTLEQMGYIILILITAFFIVLVISSGNEAQAGQLSKVNELFGFG